MLVLVSYRPLANLGPIVIELLVAYAWFRCAVDTQGDRMDAKTQHGNASG